MLNEDQKVTRNVSRKWDRVLRLASRVNYGELKIVLQNGEPVRIEQTIKNINLNTEEDFKKDLETVVL